MSQLNLIPEFRGREFGHQRNISGTTFCPSPTSLSPSETTPPLSPNPDDASIDSGVNFSLSTSPPESTTSKLKKEVTSICNIIAQCRQHKVRAKLILEEDKLWQDKATSMASHAQEATSLAQILQSGRFIGDKSKHILYVLVAYSLLYFPWDSHSLRKEKIFFLGKDEFDFSKPYTDMDLTIDDQFTNEESEDISTYQMYKNEQTMLAAIMLLEIALGKPIESFREPPDLGHDGTPHINSDFYTACRVFDSKADEFPVDFRSAVELCLHANFDTTSNSLEDEELRAEVYQRVIVPLENQLSYGFKMELKDIGMTEYLHTQASLPLRTPNRPPVVSDNNSHQSNGSNGVIQFPIPRRGVRFAN
jgi:hypothetical protein